MRSIYLLLERTASKLIIAAALLSISTTSAGSAFAFEAPPPDAPAASGVPYLVKDINTDTRGIGITGSAEMGGVLYFIAQYVGESEQTLWRSDGSAAGTLPIIDIGPGDINYTSLLVTLNGMLYFAAYDDRGYELWVSDGTQAGTSLVSDINPNGSGLPMPPYLMMAVFNDRILFTADDYTHGMEIWVSDGTDAGTVLLKDIATGVDEYGVPASSNPLFGGIQNGEFYFFADDGVHGAELWKTDGTPEGTALVADIHPGESGSQPPDFVYSPYQPKMIFAALDGVILFPADDGAHGVELWASNGSAAGTVLVKDIYPGQDESGMPYSSQAGYLSAYNDLVYFTALDGVHGAELWVSDGTSLGTRMLKDLSPGGGWGCFWCSQWLAQMGGLVYFPGDDGALGEELWRTDGSAAGTQLAADIMQGDSGSWPRGLLEFNGALYFFATDETHETELFTSDGTLQGTLLVKDINPGKVPATGYVYLFLIRSSGGRLFLLADDGLHGPELWISDGSEAGTVLVKDINTITDSSLTLGFPAVDFNDELFFLADDGVHGWDLWKSDGTITGTVFVKEIVPGSGIQPEFPYGSEWVVAGDGLYFTANDGVHGSELWRTDGSEAGTILVKDIHPSGSAGISSLAEWNGWLYFSADDGVHGAELWVSDGTPQGTNLVKDIHPAGSGSPSGMTAFNGLLYFAADDGVHGFELWASDGSPQGTHLVADIVPDAGSSGPGSLTVSGGRLFFGADDWEHGLELWASDGSEDGTELVEDINPTGSSWPAGLTDVDGKLFFTADDSLHGIQLWVSDGSEDGTHIVKEIDPGNAYYDPPKNLTGLNGKLFFSASTLETGRELWVSDGSEAGTYMVHELLSGSMYGFPVWNNPPVLPTLENVVFFIGSDYNFGGEMVWQSDGTYNGTKLVAQANQGGYSYPYLLTTAGDRLYFAAYDSLHWWELWAYPYSLSRLFLPLVIGDSG